MRFNDRGAASVLVILIVVVLATFGGIALTAGWTNKQLSIRAAQSKADYYALDSAAEEVLAEMDSLLYQAQQRALSVINGFDAANDASASDDIRLELLKDPVVGRIKSEALVTKKLNEVFARIYFYECANLLNEYAANKGLTLSYENGFEQSVDFLDTKKAAPKSGDLLLAFTVSEGMEAGDKNIDVSIAVSSPKIMVKIINEEDWLANFALEIITYSKRFEIFAWKLRQNPSDAEYEAPKFG